MNYAQAKESLDPKLANIHMQKICGKILFFWWIKSNAVKAFYSHNPNNQISGMRQSQPRSILAQNSKRSHTKWTLVDAAAQELPTPYSSSRSILRAAMQP